MIPILRKHQKLRTQFQQNASKVYEGDIFKQIGVFMENLFSRF